MNQLKVIEKNGQRVLLTSQLAESYGSADKKIRDNYSNNKHRYQEGKHFFLVQGDELKRLKNGTENFGLVGINASSVYLWTEKGAFLHAKSLNTDAAWSVYEKLVDSYFNKVNVLTEREQLKAAMRITIENDEKINEIDQRLAKVENDTRIDAFQQNVIKKQIGSRVYKVFEEHNPNELEKKLLFPKIHRNLRDAFAIPTYRDLRKVDFDEALAWIKSWRPLI